ncbi:DGQHR domain-containing protein [Ruminococcus sp. 5_1_39BFAA]|uniref:DGQHR domain-containing protein n=1 Tax=Ruminococcus sp. 5_1_39BFAA TaxID=457412 RepID=UPI00356B02EC
MKKVYLFPVQQYNTIFFIGQYDPGKLVQMADQSIEIGDVQEAQRPLDRKHLRDISDYTGLEKGMLPASVMIATKDKGKIKIKKETWPDGDFRYYVEFPETREELAAYSDSIDIIDGQHRLFAFDLRYRNENWKEDTIYEMPFSMFITPDLRTRRLLFTITNEKQKAVSSNLLLYLKSKLGMLKPEEEMYLPLVKLLGSENKSPLKGRIIMSAEKIPKGYKAKELIKILNKGKVRDLTIGTPPQPLSLEQTLDALCVYLNGWEEFYSLSYQKPQKETMTKISGLRYIFLLFSTFVDHSINTRSAFNVEFVKRVIQDLENAKGLNEEQTLFDSSLEFRGEGATVKLATDDAALLKAYLAAKSTEGFNPFA